MSDNACYQYLTHQALEFYASPRHKSRVQNKSKLLFMPLLLASLCAAQSKMKPEWAVFSSSLKWESPPPELHSQIKSASARIVVFFPSGEYGEVYCYLIRQGDGSVSISRGDGEVVGTGTWSQKGNRITVKSRIVYRTVVITGKPIPEAETIDSFTGAKEHYWTVSDDNGRYTALPHFKDWEYLADLIKCDREYFDGKKRIDGIQPCAPKPQR
ncbi:MAG TPA: hypothetical protein VJ731_01300 [Terriglobales bacterium]|nr:hypothetical protein [Terriglobales bacterium]